MSNVCLRRIETLKFYSCDEQYGVTLATSDSENHCEGELSMVAAFTRQFAYCSFIKSLEVVDIVLSSELRDSLAGIVSLLEVNGANFSGVDFSKLKPVAFRQILFGFRSLSGLCLDSVKVRQEFISDYFLAECATKGISVLGIFGAEIIGSPDEFPYLSEDGILAFCFGSKRKSVQEIYLYLDGQPRVTRDFATSLIEASNKSAVEEDVRISVGVRIASQRGMDAYNSNKIKCRRGEAFDFDGDIRLRIAFHRSGTLQMARGKTKRDNDDDDFFDIP
jgi:hypothetical protein